MYHQERSAERIKESLDNKMRKRKGSRATHGSQKALPQSFPIAVWLDKALTTRRGFKTASSFTKQIKLSNKTEDDIVSRLLCLEYLTRLIFALTFDAPQCASLIPIVLQPYMKSNQLKWISSSLAKQKIKRDTQRWFEQVLKSIKNLIKFDACIYRVPKKYEMLRDHFLRYSNATILECFAFIYPWVDFELSLPHVRTWYKYIFGHIAAQVCLDGSLQLDKDTILSFPCKRPRYTDFYYLPPFPATQRRVFWKTVLD